MQGAKARFSIRYKFLLLTSTLLVLSVLVHLWLATQIFKQDKTELIFDLNRSLVTNLRNELGGKIDSNLGRMALAVLSSHGADKQVTNQILNQDEDLVYVAIQNRDGTLKTLYRNTSFQETYGVTEAELQESLTKQIQEGGSQVTHSENESGQKIWPLSFNKNIPLIGLSRLAVEEDSKGRKISQYSVIGVMSLDGISKSIQSARSSEIVIFNSYGSKLFSVNPNAKHAELLDYIMKSPVDTMVMSYTERLDNSDQEMLGAFAKGHGVIIAAKTNADKVFTVVRQLIKRSVLFGLIVICTAFLLILFVSRSITSPLDLLILGMEKVSTGDLSLSLDIKSNDEISMLSKSFNQMIQDLRFSREQLEEINRDLEKKVQDRTRKLEEQNRAVKEAQEALLRTTRLASVGEIAGRAAHEVLNPLTAILTRLDKVQRRLQEGIKSETQILKQLRESWDKDFNQGGFDKLIEVWKSKSNINPEHSLWDEDLNVLKEISSTIDKDVDGLVEDSKFLVGEGQRINRIVSQMRSLSHVKRNQNSVSIHQILNECVKIMADLFDHEKIKVIEDYKATLDLVQLNSDEFIQSITNLLRNSLQSIREAPDKQGRIILRTHNEGNQIHIEIEDNGIGIRPEDQEKLFANQFSTKDPSEGTGLGLSISRRFIRGFAGELSLIQSDLGKGAIFGIALPLEEVEQLKEYGT